MAENKRSFLLYTDLIHTVSKLADDQAGVLFKHILKYVNDENPETDNILIQIAFEPIKQQLKRDLRKYEGIVKHRKLAGKASAEKRKQKQQVSTSVNKCQQDSTNATDNVNDNVNDNVSVIDNIWDTWKKYKREEFGFKYKSKVSEDAAKKELLNLSGRDLETAIKIVEQSIAKGWKGFFKLEKHGTDKKSGVTEQELAEIVARKFGVDSSER